MSDSSLAAQAGEGQPGGTTAGQLLMQMRQAAGVHIAALATTLKVPVERLEALEADDYEAFSDKVFMRALAASACRVLKHDPAPVLALLPGSRPAPLRIDKGINASFKDAAPRGSFNSGAAEAPRSRLLGVVVALLLVGALAIVLWPAGLSLDSLIGRGSGDAPAAVQQAATGDTTSAGAAETPAAATAQTDTVAADSPTPAPATPGAAEQPPAPPPPVAAAPTAPAAPASAAAPDSDAILVLRASAPSWVQVRSGGAVVLQKTLDAGESAPVPGQGPWSLVIGKADVTEVIVRGQAMDLKALARDNVARFEVK